MLLESTSDEYQNHFEKYRNELENKHNKTKHLPAGMVFNLENKVVDGVPIQGVGRHISTYRTPHIYKEKEGQDNPDYFAHFDDKGTHVYNPKTSKIETFSQIIHDRNFRSLPDEITSKIEKLPQNKITRLHRDLVDGHSVPSTVENIEDTGALHDYTKDSTVNTHLLKVVPELTDDRVLKEHAKDLHNAINKHGKPLEKPINVYSGVGFNPVEHNKDGIFSTPAFTSSSIDPKIASRFGRTGYNPETNETSRHIAHFKLPAGFKNGVYMTPHTISSEEREYLINKDQKWKHEKTIRLSKDRKITNDTTHTFVHTFTPVDD